jgi:RNA polymerase sigma factor (sigma-70 family)
MSAALERTNAAWLLELRDPGPLGEHARSDLRELVLVGLRRGLGRRLDASDLLQDFAQESVMRILGQLGSFRDESRFSTWALAIAMRVAFSALRRHHWRDASLDALLAGNGAGAPEPPALPAGLASRASTPEREVARREILAVLERCATESLTERQRKVVLAELRGMPQEEIAAQLGMNRNAVYKLCHDARRALQQGLEAAGHSADGVRWAFE